MAVVIQILSEVSSIVLPFGFTFGVFCVAIWSIPMLVRFIKSIF